MEGERQEGVTEQWSNGVMEWWSGGVVVWWCGGVVVWWCGGVVDKMDYLCVLCDLLLVCLFLFPGALCIC
jgi:hypothetical protein